MIVFSDSSVPWCAIAVAFRHYRCEYRAAQQVSFEPPLFLIETALNPIGELNLQISVFSAQPLTSFQKKWKYVMFN